MKGFFQPAVRALRATRRHPAFGAALSIVIPAVLDPLVREAVDALMRC